MNLLEVPIEAVQSNLKNKTISVTLVCIMDFILALFVENGDILSKWMDFVSIYIILMGSSYSRNNDRRNRLKNSRCE